MYQDRAQRASATTDFEFLSKLGQGSFGVVYKVRRKLDRNIYVLKQINIAQMNAQLRKEALNEVKILSSLDNPYIVRYYESFLEKNYLNIVMEYCEGGDLAQYIKVAPGKYLTEPKIWKFLIQMCVGLAYIHGKKILHRDIKSMNVFLSKQEEVRIGDLGVAKALADTGNFAHTMIGTPYYLSPEMCEEKPYNSKSDMWAFGCVLYEMCTKRHPFEATNQAALILKIINGKFAPISPTFSPELTQILNQCLCRDYKKRPSAKTIIAHPAFQLKAKELCINLGEYDDPNIYLKDVSSRLPPQKSQDEPILKREDDRLKPKTDKDSVKEKSPMPRVNAVAQKENADNRIITPAANNAFKIKPAIKAPSKDDYKPKSPRPKSPLENPSAAILKRNLPSNDLVSPKPILNRDKSPTATVKPKDDRIVHKDVSVNNPERNIKRIRKGAPQVLGRQAAIAGNQYKAQPKPAALKPAAEAKSKSRSPIGRDISAEQRRTPSSDDFEREEDSKEEEVKPIATPKSNITPSLPDSKQELEQVSQDKIQSTEEDKVPSIAKVEEENVPSKEQIQVNSQNDFGNNTQFEPIVSEVQWNIIEQKPTEEPIKVNNQENKPKVHDVEEIPVFHIAKDVPTFEMNAISPELEDNEDEEHEYWNSDDEEAYNNDRFEEEEGKEERKENKGYESPEYEEDFESDGDTTDDTNRKSSFEKMTEARKEATKKKLEKAKKEKEDIERLIQDRSAVFVETIGEEQWKEMISFLRKKMEFVQNEKDLKEMNEYLKKKVGGKLPAEQINFIMIKILPFEMKKGRLEDEIREYNFELQ